MPSSNAQILDKIIKHMQDGDDEPFTHLIDRYYTVRDRLDVLPLRLKEYSVAGPDVRSRPPGRLSPSAIAGCERQAAFQFLGVQGKKRKDPELQAVFDQGHWVHHRWQYNFLDMQAIMPHRIQVLGIEAPVIMPKLYVAGSLDISCKVHSPEKNRWHKWVIDVKSINDFGFAHIYRTRTPKEEHVRQLIAYMRAKKIRRGALLYDNKNNQNVHIFPVQFDPEEWSEVSRWCKRVVKMMERQEVPPMHPDCDHGNFLYGKCPFKSICWSNVSETKIQKIAYRGFDSVQGQWERGLELADG